MAFLTIFIAVVELITLSIILYNHFKNRKEKKEKQNG
jgi:hypothetical protein